jgi:capsule biosynthesis phosphatase
MKYILLCGGIGSRYNNYSLPKPLNYIYGKHMIEYTIANIPSDEIYIIYNVFLDQYHFKEIIINKFKSKIIHFSCVEYLTRGAVETAYVGIQQFRHLLVGDTENIVFIDNDNLHQLSNLNHHYETSFIGYGIDETEKSNYSFIQIGHDNIVTNIEEKRKISNYFCCGLYGFANTSQFIKYAKLSLYTDSKTNNEFYFSQLYKTMLPEGERILPVYIEKTQHIGSYKELTNHTLDLVKPKLRICFDLDNTLVTYPTIINDYNSVMPIEKNIALLNLLKDEGHEIIIYTARRMTTHNNNVGKVIKDIALTTINTLEKFQIRYDELIFGKPIADVYIDDRAMNPYINNITHYGFFIQSEDFLPNKIENNKYNSVSLVDNTIIKRGPEQFVRGELFYYQSIPDELAAYFPKLLGHDDFTDETHITLMLEYVKGLPLFYLYKHKLITPKIMDGLFALLNKLHTTGSLTENPCPTDANILNNYFEKLKKRFANNSDYPFDDANAVYIEMMDDLHTNYSAEKVAVIHGDFWFSNIIITYDDSFKLIDMKGQVDGVLTTGGDRYYDYGKLYQSIIGYDLILNGIELDHEYIDRMHEYFMQKCGEIGLNIRYLKSVTRSLIFGTFHSIDKSETIKRNIWELLKSIS